MVKTVRNGVSRKWVRALKDDCSNILNNYSVSHYWIFYAERWCKSSWKHKTSWYYLVVKNCSLYNFEKRINNWKLPKITSWSPKILTALNQLCIVANALYVFDWWWRWLVFKSICPCLSSCCLHCVFLSLHWSFNEFSCYLPIKVRLKDFCHQLSIRIQSHYCFGNNL